MIIIIVTAVETSNHTKEHSVSETRSVSCPQMRGETPTLLGPLKRAKSFFVIRQQNVIYGYSYMKYFMSDGPQEQHTSLNLTEPH
jgi:hypothetical protein